LLPWADESSTRPAGAGGQGRGVPGAGAMGGGMGGGVPGQGGDKGAKGKRVQGEEEDESLYTEDRAWTEGVVGLRGGKDVPDL